MSLSVAPNFPQADAAQASLRGPIRLAVALLVVTTITILKGALTTSTGSGMAFADWPRSDGQWLPERSYTTVAGFLEHFHRVAGATAGALVLWLAVWLQVSGLASRAARSTAWFGLVLITIQGIIGGVGVQKNLPAVTSVTHGTLAQLTLATFAWLTYQLSQRYQETMPLPGVAPGTGRRLAVAGLLLLVVQTVAGAIARHTNSPHALWMHVGNAFVVFILLAIVCGFAVGRMAAVPGLRKLSQILMTLLFFQLALGFVALLVRNQAGKTPENVANLGTATLISVHVVLGALLTVLTATLAAHIFRATRVIGSVGGADQ